MPARPVGAVLVIEGKTRSMTSRRDFFRYAGVTGGAVAISAVSRVAMAALPEPVIQTRPDTMPPLVPGETPATAFPSGLLRGLLNGLLRSLTPSDAVIF